MRVGVGLDVQLAVEVVARGKGRVLLVVAGQQVQNLAGRGDGLVLGVHDDVGRAGFGQLLAAAKVLGGQVPAGAGGDHLRAGDVHLARLVGDDDHVRHRRHERRAAGAGAEDQGDLRHDAGDLGRLLHDAGTGVQGLNALEQVGAGRVAQRDDGRAGLGGQLHHAHDLVGGVLAHGAGLDRKVLRIGVDRAVVHRAVAGDHAAGLRLARGKHPGLAEAALVKEPALRRGLCRRRPAAAACAHSVQHSLRYLQTVFCNYSPAENTAE